MNGPHDCNLSFLRQRALLLRQLRAWFDSRQFYEVQPPCLSRDCVLDAAIDPIRVESEQLGLAVDLPVHLYLQTSPEAAMKRMLAAGAPSIYSLGPVFRGGERGDYHNVEFTMLEWYQIDAKMRDGIETLGQLAVDILDREGYDVINYRELVRDAIGLDPIDGDLRKLRQVVSKFDRHLAKTIDGDRDGLLDVVMSQVVQPQLGIGRPLIVNHYPLSQAALARRASDDPQCAARFELFVDGVELANGYDELRDADVLLERLEHANATRQRLGREAVPVPGALVDAMRRGLPPCAGVALGVDRLLMVRTGETKIENVIFFPIELA